MKPFTGELPLVNLRPGELYVAREPTIVSTILGSCIAVCLYSPQTRMGAMCHGVLPYSRRDDGKEAFRFVDTSVAYMIEVLAGQQRVAVSQLEAKLFGGANVLAVAQQRGKLGTIGAQNVEAARLSLRKYGVPITVERVGGDLGCKLFFYTNTGEVLVRSIRRAVIPGYHG